MRIGELAAATGLSRDALRFYETRGLLTARRRANGYRDYPAEAVEWLCYLRAAQSLGFTLAEIEADLPLLAASAAAPDSAAASLRAALMRKLDDIDARIAGLTALRAGLAARLGNLGADCPLRPVPPAQQARPATDLPALPAITGGSPA